MIMQQQFVKLIQPQNYKKVNHLTKSCEIRSIPFDVRVPRTLKQPHFALERIRMTVIHLTLNGARIIAFKSSIVAFV
jgi:hypothetical protein